MGVCAAPAVLVPESFRTEVRCPFGECAYCARISLQSAVSLAVREPERLWEFAPSVEPGTLQSRFSLLRSCFRLFS